MLSTSQLIKIGKLLLDLVLVNFAFGISNLVIFYSFWIDGWSYPFLFIIINISTFIIYLFTNQSSIFIKLRYKNYLRSIKFYLLYNLAFIGLIWFLFKVQKYYFVHLILFVSMMVLLWTSVRYYLYGFVQKLANKILNSNNCIVISNAVDENGYSKIESLNFKIIDTSSSYKSMNINYYMKNKNVKFIFIDEDLKIDIKTSDNIYLIKPIVNNNINSVYNSKVLSQFDTFYTTLS